MIKEATVERFGWARRGLRTRFTPRVPLCRGLINAAPWINIVLLVGAFLVLQSRVVLKPGVVMQLPETTLVSGSGRGIFAVATSSKTGESGIREEMIFFDDEPFYVASADGMKELKKRLFRKARDNPDTPLIIEADISVQYGTVVMLCDMARAAGFQSANLAQRAVESRQNEK